MAYYLSALHCNYCLYTVPHNALLTYIIVSDPHQDSDLLVITILDENDQRPIFTRTSYRAEITENAAAGRNQAGVPVFVFSPE